MDEYSPANRLTLISHAVTKALRKAAFPLDEPLELLEYAKIESLRWQAPRAQQILCGPELRTQQTAQALGLRAEISRSLSDCDYGSWNGLELAEVQSRDPGGIAKWLEDLASAPHGGESIAKLIERVGIWMEQQKNTGHTIAITHPAVIRSAMVHALAAPPQAFWRIDISPLSLTDLRFNGRVWTLRCSGCTLHRQG